MAQLPTVTGRSVAPDAALSYSNVPYSPEMFGDGIGRAFRGLGANVSQLATIQKLYQDDVRSLDAQDKKNQAADEIRKVMWDPNGGLLTQKGANAQGSSEMLEQHLQTIKQKYSDQIQDPITKRAFEKLWLPEREQAKDKIAVHEAQETETYKADVTNATRIGAMQSAYDNYNDPGAIQKAVEETQRAIRVNSLGKPPELVAAAEREAVSSIHLAVISRYAAEDPSRALQYYKDHKKEITEKDHITATQFTQTASDYQKSRQLFAQMSGQSEAGNSLFDAVVTVESGGNTGAVSPAGALGVSQLMPDTARYVAQKYGFGDVAQLSDEDLTAALLTNEPLNRQLGKLYLNEQLQAFGGDIEAALVAYNAGPEGAKDFLEHNAGARPGQRDYNVPGRSKIKSETEGYVQKVLGNLGVGNASVAKMTRETWSLKNFTPEDLMAPTEGGQWVDARAAQGLDSVAEAMKVRFPGLSIKVNEPHTFRDRTAAGPAGPTPGMLEKGNIDLAARKVAKNADGSISTVRSTSFNIEGQEVLIPTVIDGKVVSNQEALAHYKKTGEHLGKFDTPEHATAYSRRLHDAQEKYYTQNSGSTAGKRRGTSDPKDNPHVDKSQHIYGRAFDVQVQGWSDEEKAAFLEEARKQGFGGIGFYGPGGHLHIDMGTPRTWGSMPEWAKAAMQVPVSAPTTGVPYSTTSSFGGAGGTGTAPGMPGAWYADTRKPAIAAMMEQSLAIVDPQQQAQVQEMIRTYGATQQAAIEAQAAQLKNQAWQAVLNGGIEDIPPEVTAQLGSEEWSKLYEFTRKRAELGGVKTDWGVYSKLKTMPAEELAKQNPYDYRKDLGDTEYKEVNNDIQQAIRAQQGDENAKKALAGTRTVAQITKDTFDTLGWSAGKPGSRDAIRMGEFNTILDQRITLEGQAKGRALTAVEVQDIVDKLLIVNHGAGILQKSLYGFQTKTPDDFIAVEDWSSVQPDDQRLLIDRYQQYYGKTPDRETATDLYNRAFQVYLGGRPTGPDEEVEFFQQMLEKKLGYRLSAQRMEPYYGEWLLTFLGR